MQVLYLLPSLPPHVQSAILYNKCYFKNANNRFKQADFISPYMEPHQTKPNGARASTIYRSFDSKCSCTLLVSRELHKVPIHKHSHNSGQVLPVQCTIRPTSHNVGLSQTFTCRVTTPTLRPVDKKPNPKQSCIKLSPML